MGRKEPWNILDEAVGGPELAGDANEFMEEGGAGAAKSDALPGDGKVLAGESAHQQIDGGEGIPIPLPRATSGAASPFPVCPLCAFSGGLIASGAPRPFRATRASKTNWRVTPSSECVDSTRIGGSRS
jgi:hypothetical protein